MKRTSRRTPRTELEVAAASRVVRRFMPLIAQLSPVNRERLENIASALIVATDEEMDTLQDLIDNAEPSNNYEHVSAAALGIIKTHRKQGE